MRALLCFSLLIFFSVKGFSQEPFYKSDKFSIYPDKIVQGKNEAKALSDTKLVSNYQSPANLFQSADITFKFALNERDNEMPPGVDHQFGVVPVDGKTETPIIKFGKQLKNINPSGKYLAPNTLLKIKLDLNDVLNDFKTNGFYTTYKGDKIYKDDFKGVYVAGASAPMTWDFDNLHNTPQLKLQDDDGDGIYETTIILNKTSDIKLTDAAWELSKDVSAYPQYNSGLPITNAIYNLSLEEMVKAVEPDSTFRTGKEWGGVWTRDISYSIILSMAYLQPRVAMNSLLKKVNKKKKIIQDTGTGGAWPVSTDRTIWSVAAWELYKATGDKDWLQQAYEIIKNSMENDLKTSYDKTTGMFRGESSFLDWREQTYPKWMQPADIFESECLGTNAAFYQANTVLAKMARLLHHDDVAKKYDAVALGVKNGINKYLWIPEKKYYAQYLYGRNYKIASPRSEALGEALCVVFGIADEQRAKTLIENVPVTDYGIPCIYPQIPNIPPYHNNAIWPFVQTYWLWAAAKAGNEKAVLESMADIYRPAGMFLTNKENMVADNGDFKGTQVNSSVMLWSLSGNLSMVHKVLFGIYFNDSTISFQPFVPKSMAGKRTLTNFKYRNAILNIVMEGYGNRIKSFYVDGKATTNFSITGDAVGTHSINIILANNITGNNKINKVKNVTSLPAPDVKLVGNKLILPKSAGNNTIYTILKNGKPIGYTNAISATILVGTYAEYSVIANASFASEPIEVYSNDKVQQIEAEKFIAKADKNYKGFSGEGFVETSTTVNTDLALPLKVATAGYYAISLRYANGNGPVNTENKCAIRTLKVNGSTNGVLVLPQRGSGEWSNWGYSNSIKVYLKKGNNNINISLEDYNENMNGVVNQAMIDLLKVVKL